MLTDEAKSFQEKMKELGVAEDDIEESFVRASGPGGQNVNKVSSCVILLHRPSGVRVKCQQTRHQHQNRIEAMRLLLAEIERHQKEKALHHTQAIEKRKRQNRKRPQSLKEQILEFKRKRKAKKQSRGRSNVDELD